MAKTYSFGNRFVAPAFRRAINDILVRYVSTFTLIPMDIVQLTCWVFEHIPSDRPLLQLLVNQFCEDWDDYYDEEENYDALKLLPQAFTIRVLKRHSHSKINREAEASKCCFYEHASDEEKASCGKSHMVYKAHEGYGYFQ